MSGKREQRQKARKTRTFRKRVAAVIAIALVIIGVVAVYKFNSGGTGPSPTGNVVLLETSMGNITIKLYNDMPITAGNFRNLVSQGSYDGTIFHRVSRGFVIQGGDLTSKGITVRPIQDELPNKHSNVRGSVAMAKTSEPNSATSQFFINLNDSNAAKLNSSYSVFGMVTAGMDVVDAISQVPITPGLSATDGKPVQDVTLIKAEITG